MKLTDHEKRDIIKLDELIGIGLLEKRKIGRDNYYINIALYDLLNNVHKK